MNKSQLKILLVLIEPPLPFGNAASRWFFVLYNELRRRGHKVTTLVASGVEKDIAQAIKEFPQPEHDFHIFPFASRTSPLSRFKNYFSPHSYKFSSDFLKKLKALKPETYDVIHAEQTWTGLPLLPWRNKCLLNIHYLLALDLQDLKNESLREKIAHKNLFHMEKEIIEKYPFVRSCTHRLTDYIRSWKFQQQLFTVPFGIDLNQYEFVASEYRNIKKPILTLIGNMNWHPSLNAAERLLEKIWPDVRRTIPNVKLRIIGWGARSRLKKYLEMKDVEIIENVDDIKKYFQEATAMVYAPHKGSGMKIKIQEALAFGVPVITNFEGAEGLVVKDMVHMAIANKDKELVERTRIVLENKDIQESLRKNGRKLLEEQCSPQSTVDGIEKCYQTILHKNELQNHNSRTA